MPKKAKQAKQKAPKTVQQAIPYIAVYPDSGIIELQKGVFSRSYLLQDINFSVAKESDQVEIFRKYGHLLNSIDNSYNVQVTINNKNIDKNDFQKNILLRLCGDGFDKYRKEYNKMLLDKMNEGKNSVIKEIYFTISFETDSYDTALRIFSRLDTEIPNNFKAIGNSQAFPISTMDRLKILHNIYNVNHEENFDLKTKTYMDGQSVTNFSWETMKKQGITTKDIIAPPSLKFNFDHFILGGETYGRVLFISELPNYLTDKFIFELTNTNFNMLTSINIKPVSKDKAVRQVSNYIVNTKSAIQDRQRKASRSGYDASLNVPAWMLEQEADAEELLQNLRVKDQNMFLTTFVITHFASDLETLNKDTAILTSIGKKFSCVLKKLMYQQAAGFTSSLPLAYNKIEIERVLDTDSLAVFIPFSSQEMMNQTGFYYGLNSVSRNMILPDRRLFKNCNGMVLGSSGSGKSFACKGEMINVLLNTNDDVIVIDPEREYSAMAQMLGGEVIRIAPGSSVHINPCDMDADYADEDNPVTLKSDFILSLCEVVVGGRHGLDPVQRAIIDRCCIRMYEEYVKDFNPENIPTLLDFHRILEGQPEREAKALAVALEMYTKGNLDMFAHKTNVDINNRFVVYDIKDVGKNIKTMAMLVVLDNVWNRLIANQKIGRRTWFYLDEIYLLLGAEQSANFLKELFKRARKWGGVPTGITQNVEDLLTNEAGRGMITNCEFVQILAQSAIDAEHLAELLHISPAQLSYIQHSNKGEGLLYLNGIMIPFVNKFPANTELYLAMSTSVEDFIQQ